MMHVMYSTTIFNPYTIDSSNLVIDGCFAAIRETTEDCTVNWSGFVGVCDVSRLLWFLLFSTTATFAFPFRLLSPFGLFGEVFFGNALVTFFSRRVVKSAVPTGHSGFLRWKETRARTVLSSHIGLDCVWIVSQS